MHNILQRLQVDGVPFVRLESDFLRVDVAPEVGGRVVSLVEKKTGLDVLWRNERLALERLPKGSEYDPNFFGGIDELLPNDIPETINGVACPDHGELWTTPLTGVFEGERLFLRGELSQFGLTYERGMSLNPEASCLEFSYRIANASGRPREFLWKLHAALAVRPGDVVECPARTGQVVDLGWSRYKTLNPFPWPSIEGQAVNVIPAPDGTMDFFYLFDLAKGELGLRSHDRGLKFVYHFDLRVFPYAWLFASYGGFNGHYTVILEPCTAMPISVKEAAAKKQCSHLEPGETLETKVTVRVEPIDESIEA